MKYIEKGKALPFILTGLIILVDQGVKSYIAAAWPRNGTLIKDLLNGFLQIYHVRNKAIAFSLGHNIPDTIKPVLFIILPILVLGFLLWYYLKSDEFAGIQRWAVAGIIGGGAGNIIDRIFRPDGVVDFISVKFYGFLGLERWPTFNIADASVVVSCIILFVSIMVSPKREENKAAP
ncbi:MAG: signal peptidase II [Treponema sp.]|jgi:signal peptidase II|nr:signal peptidase II [Treponema sp.]